jgi:hypothetical protein
MAKQFVQGSTKTQAVLQAIREMVKGGVLIDTLSPKACNAYLKDRHGITVSEPLFYSSRKRVKEQDEKDFRRQQDDKFHREVARQARVKAAAAPANNVQISMEDLPNLLTQARDLIRRLGSKEHAKQFIDVV